MKSSHYYIFWGIATAAVVAGQLYVGTGYRLLHNSMQELLNKVDGVLFFEERDRGGKYFQNCFNNLKTLLNYQGLLINDSTISTDSTNL